MIYKSVCPDIKVAAALSAWRKAEKAKGAKGSDEKAAWTHQAHLRTMSWLGPDERLAYNKIIDRETKAERKSIFAILLHDLSKG